MNETLRRKASVYLDTLCNVVGDRSVGSEGNIKATEFFENSVSPFGWEIEKDELDVMDWTPGSASLTVKGESFNVSASPYSNGCECAGELVPVSCHDELEEAELKGRVLLLHGDIAKEQLMPKNFVFYNPENHRRIISLLEEKKPEAIICATGRNPGLAGGAYPFPLIEDGDFDIPSVYMTDIEGERLIRFAGEKISVHSSACRITSKAWNITAVKGRQCSKRLVITAHIDAKKGTPGAIDNATGVVTLLLLAELISGYSGGYSVELVPLNGEDYYAVPGQMCYIKKNEGRFGDIALNINIDGAGYFEGDTAFSFYGIPDNTKRMIKEILKVSAGASEGPEWPQGDHSIFVQYGVPAIAVSSMWFTDNMYNQDVTHTEKDRPEIVDIMKTVQVAQIIAEIVMRL